MGCSVEDHVYLGGKGIRLFLRLSQVTMVTSLADYRHRLQIPASKLTCKIESRPEGYPYQMKDGEQPGRPQELADRHPSRPGSFETER